MKSEKRKAKKGEASSTVLYRDEDVQKILDVVRVMRNETFWMNGRRVPTVERYVEQYADRISVAVNNVVEWAESEHRWANYYFGLFTKMRDALDSIGKILDESDNPFSVSSHVKMSGIVRDALNAENKTMEKRRNDDAPDGAGAAERRRDRRRCAFYNGKGGCRFHPGFDFDENGRPLKPCILDCEGTNRCKIYKEVGK